MSINTKQSGDQAEQRALSYLQRQGLRLRIKNYRCSCGEIDLIMQDHEHLIFVEVRLRLNRHFGNSFETITRKKQQRIIRAALHYLQTQQNADYACRFDAIGINNNNKIEWIKNAFQVQY